MNLYDKLCSLTEPLAFKVLLHTWDEVRSTGLNYEGYSNFHISKDNERIELMAWWKSRDSEKSKEINLIGVNNNNRLYIRDSMLNEYVTTILRRHIRTQTLESIGI